MRKKILLTLITIASTTALIPKTYAKSSEAFLNCLKSSCEIFSRECTHRLEGQRDHVYERGGYINLQIPLQECGHLTPSQLECAYQKCFSL